VKAWQRQIREKKALTDASANLFGAWWEEIDTSIEKAVCREVDFITARGIIEEYEWLGTMYPAAVCCFGIFFDGKLGGVIVFGAPTPPSLGSSVAGQSNTSKVVQLGRGACVHWAHPHSASKLIAFGLREIEKRGYRIVIAFSDPEAGEIGTVYQATNWIYCGLTAVRPDYFDGNGKRITGCVGVIKPWMTKAPRKRKGRYVYLLGSKKERKELRGQLLWPLEPYPKRAVEVSGETRIDSVNESVGQFHDAAPIL